MRRARRDPSAELTLLLDEAIRVAYKGERQTSLSLVLWDATVEKTGPLQLVRGHQADSARALGLTKITRGSAEKVWDVGLPIVFVGSNVNTYHFFKNTSLAYVARPQGQSFKSVFNNVSFYMEPEIGRPVTFMFGLPPHKRAKR